MNSKEGQKILKDKFPEIRNFVRDQSPGFQEKSLMYA
jgi:hypothetical protein